MTRNGRKMAIFELEFSFYFLPKLKHTLVKQFVIDVIDFDQIGTKTCLAPQNDSQYQTFVKYVHVVGKILGRNDC